MQFFRYALLALCGEMAGHRRFIESTKLVALQRKFEGVGFMERTLREGWTFTYTLEELLNAADAKWAHHNGRLTFWEGELATREKTLISKGLKLTAHVKKGMSTNYAQERASFDNELYAQFEEAQERVAHHNVLVLEFARWKRAIAHEIKTGEEGYAASRQLTVNDIEHFGL